jgi:hypothetical protein
MGVNKKRYSQQKQGVSVMERCQPKGVKLKIGQRELRSGVNWHGALNQKKA